MECNNIPIPNTRTVCRIGCSSKMIPMQFSAEDYEESLILRKRAVEAQKEKEFEDEAIEFSSKRDQSAITSQRTISQSIEQVHKRLEPSNEEGPWNERRGTPRTDSKTGVPW